MTKFKATIVETFKNEFAEDSVVFNIFLEEFDPEEGGESWNFQRALGADGTLASLGEKDNGVCTVKEIQQVTLYEGIQKLELSRTQLFCLFDPDGSNETGIETLEIRARFKTKP